MKYLSLVTACLCLSACLDDSGTNGPGIQIIIETGYLRCTPAVDGCEGALTCADDMGNSGCVDAPADACTGEATCECEGGWLCGERLCTDVAGGFECQESAYRILSIGLAKELLKQRPDSGSA